jgi:hypothetical protein
MRNFIGRGNFTWFVGVVEDINDPIKIGRVRVRAFGWHTDDKNRIPTDSLPWAVPVNPVTGASTSGIGTSPTGMMQGSWVIGFFMDGERAQEPAIMGTIASISEEKGDIKKGFTDPDGEFPRDEYLAKPDVNKLALGEQTRPHTLDTEIGEPDDPYKAEYPHNHVMETRSGHIKEYDDTPDHERIRELHKSGTFYEVHPDGSVVTHIVKDGYRVVANNESIHVKGNVTLIIDQNCTTKITGNWDVDVEGDITIDGKTINLNSGSKGAARLDDTTKDNDSETNGADEGKITSSSGTVFIGD